MNELELFTEWWNRQDKYVFKKANQKSYDPYSITLKTVLDAYEKDRPDMIRSIIIERILESEDVYKSEKLAKKIYRELQKLEEDNI